MSSFYISADVRVGGGTDRPADGFSFNFARPTDPVLTGGAFSGIGTEVNLPEEGTQTGLAIGFDEWQSGPVGPGLDNVGFSIRLDDVLVGSADLPTLNGAVDDTTSLQTGPNGGGVDGLGWAKISIHFKEDKNLEITWKGATIFDEVVAFDPGPGQLIFSGRTGGANAAHHLDNIFVVVPEPGSLGMVGLGGVLLLLRRRRR